ncbi:mechanosensitive ion channel family protein [Clostridium sp.]|uniref:mechanosensitive ion channel family protein n=1 Tax=Clostridium sp. TaxID=1506 RepID=UPI003D6CB5ED
MFQSILDFFTKNDILNDFIYYKFKYVGIAIGVFALFALLKKIFAKYVFKIILRLADKTKFDADTKIIEAFEKPVTSFFGVLGFYFGFKILTMAYNVIKIPTIDKVFSAVVVILISWGVYNLTEESSVLFEKMHKAYDIKVDKILFPFISKILRFIIIALAINVIADIWSIPIQGFITGLGLGGLAFALAAKDAAANIIAGIFIILDKPFTIGDWVSIDNLEGTIESISFRTTKIRTFDEAIITVPNSKLANEPLTNFSRRGKRRINFNLGVTYGTSSEKLQSCVDNIRDMIVNHPQVNKQTIFVNFDKFSASSLDIFIYFFVDTTALAEYLKIKENINFNIIQILEQVGVSMAFPSTSIYVETLPNKKEEENFKLVDSFQKNKMTIENDKE